jgi:hypothetical protein
MSHGPANPHRVCATCRYFGELIDGGTSVWCERPEQRHVNACGYGCVFWEREPGADDELPAAATPVICTLPSTAMRG